MDGMGWHYFIRRSIHFQETPSLFPLLLPLFSYSPSAILYTQTFYCFTSYPILVLDAIDPLTH